MDPGIFFYPLPCYSVCKSVWGIVLSSRPPSPRFSPFRETQDRHFDRFFSYPLRRSTCAGVPRKTFQIAPGRLALRFPSGTTTPSLRGFVTPSLSSASRFFLTVMSCPFHLIFSSPPYFLHPLSFETFATWLLELRKPSFPPFWRLSDPELFDPFNGVLAVMGTSDMPFFLRVFPLTKRRRSM